MTDRAAAERPPSPATRRVLVVDDHVVFGEMLAAALSAAGLRCVGVLTDATDVVAQVGRLGPDVVVMDIEMPEIDGITATRGLRGRHPGVAVVIASAHLTRRRREDAVLAGASAVIDKDGALDVLLEALRRAVPPPGPLSGGVLPPPSEALRPPDRGGIVRNGTDPL